MAKIPIILNGNICHNMNELKENFNIKEIIACFHDGKLQKWLKERYYNKEMKMMESLSKEDETVPMVLCEIFEIDPKTQDFSDIGDIETLIKQKEKLKTIKENTDDPTIIEHPEKVAFNQEELAELLDRDIQDIYLCKGNFTIPVEIKNKNYHGVSKLSKLVITIPSDKPVDFEVLNITFDDLLKFDNKYQKIIDTLQQKPKTSSNFDETIKQCKEKIKNEIDTRKQFELYLKCANLDDVESMCEVAERFLRGDGTNHSSKEAIQWFEKAVEFGNIKAMEKLGQIYNEGHLRDDKKSFEYYEKAANLGSVTAMKALSKMYEWGAGVTKDIGKAQEWAKKANDLETAERLRKIDENFKITEKSDEWGDGINN